MVNYSDRSIKVDSRNTPLKDSRFKIPEIHRSTSEKYNEVLEVNSNNNANVLRFIQIKTFKGEYSENPSEYLQSLEELFSLSTMSEREKLAVASNHLYAAAKDWWWSLFDKPRTYNDFRYLIMSSFWGEGRQEDVRYRVSHERYSIQKGNYTQFFRSQAVKLKTLTIYPMSERQIVRILRHNLPRHVEHTLIAADRETIEEVAEILDALSMSEGCHDVKVKSAHDHSPYTVSNVNVWPTGGYRPRSMNARQGRNIMKNEPYRVYSPVDKGKSIVSKNDYFKSSTNRASDTDVKGIYSPKLLKPVPKID